MHRSSRMEGRGRLDTLSEMHLDHFGEFEVAVADDWDLDDVSMIELCMKEKGDDALHLDHIGESEVAVADDWELDDVNLIEL